MNSSDTPSEPSTDTDILPVAEHSPSTGLARRLLGLVVLVAPLVLAALWAVVGPTPQQPETAPGAGGPLRSALSEASANSSFTVAGAEQLRSGTSELADGAGQLRDGSAELATGMEQLQAGMGQAGSGADEVAGGVSQVVGAVRGVAVIQGQVSTAIEDALSRLRGDAPEVVQARNALTGLRDQLAAQGLDQNTLSNLDQLDSGATELARQLSAPGADLRDGVYEATRGARALAGGAGELATGADALRDGAASVADSAGRTQESIGKTGRALAVEQGDAGVEAAEAADDSQRRTSAGILGVAAAAVLGALLVQLVRRPGSSIAESVLALALLTAGLSAWALATADVHSAAGATAAVGVVALVVVASAALWRALVAVLGPWPGRIAAAILAAASAGAAWWVWVAGGAPSAVVTATSATTTGQATAALDAVLLAGPAAVAWTGAAVLVAVAVFSLLAARIAGRPRPRA
ncbi:hypothetical protein [Dietzia sp. ANT_WB102]|uniref:hypothetical protein n=1 Tax=Dietzia sp. ANT_WB102 TaxID=2597345 RepID=UPI0011F07B34|nr:hypothetical protein [Dietzia sp. ANT_WB102]KAA0917988.1 hypothetical protein FQ137_00850 [Dietzia sp. ANT_WB102]